MAQAKVNNNKNLWYLAWALILVGAIFAGAQAMQDKGPVIRWKRVVMDGHRTGAKPVTADNLAESLGSFDDEGYVTPSGVRYEETSSVAQVAQELMEVQPQLIHLKQVIGHSAGMYMNLTAGQSGGRCHPGVRKPVFPCAHGLCPHQLWRHPDPHAGRPRHPG